MSSDIGYRIRKHRELKGLTQQQMADVLGMAVSNYNKIENNKLELTVSRMLEIVNILKINVNVLLEIENDNGAKQTIHDNAGLITGNYNTNYFSDNINEIIKSQNKS